MAGNSSVVMAVVAAVLSIHVATAFAACTFTVQKEGTVVDFSRLRQVNDADYFVQEGAEGQRDFSYFINICAPVRVGGTGNNPDVAVYQKSNGADERDFVLGLHSQTTLTRRADGDLLMTLGGGELCHNSKFSRKTYIHFDCDSTFASAGYPVFDLEDSNCTYSFTWRTNACYNPYDALVNTKNSSVSVGSVVVIVFAVVILLYLVLGILYKRVVMGAKGVEQIPNIDTWRSIGATCASIRCWGRSRDNDTVKYRGLDDAEDQDEDDRMVEA
eukprot:Opistho-1_new@10116